MKKTKVWLTLLLTLALCLLSFSAVWADDDAAADTDKAAITKLLKVPFGTDTSGLTFVFEIESKTVNDATATYDGTTEKYNMPTIGLPTEIGSLKGTVDIVFNGDEKLVGTTSGISTYFLESDNLITADEFPHAGIFVYTITENETKSTQAKTGGPKEVISYSKAEYKVIFYVSEDGDGDLEITHIGVLNTKDDAGTAISAENQTKVDPTPDPDGDGKNYSKMTFTNTLVRTWDGTEPEDDDDWTLAISKVVEGTYGDKTKYFSYNMTITAPSLVPHTPSAPKYKAYVVEADSSATAPKGYKVVTSSENFAGSITDNAFEVTTDVPFTFNLKDGQYLVFIDTPVGTSYIITETGASGYIPKVSVIYDGKAAVLDDGGATKYTSGTPIVLPNDRISSDNLYVGEELSKAAFTNTRDEVTPTGLNLNDIPFIGMIALAFGALIAFVAVKARKRKIYSQY